jgi:hypothetical protein
VTGAEQLISSTIDTFQQIQVWVHPVCDIRPCTSAPPYGAAWG